MIRVIHEEPEFLALDKPAGISAHKGASVKGETVADWLVRHYPEARRVGDEPATRPGIVHRLDKETSGVMVAARSQKAFDALKKLFKERRIEKIYLALVAGSTRKSGIIDAPIGRLAANPTKRGVGEKTRSSRPAKTSYRTLERIGGWSLLEVKPLTGRMHQIRVHLSSIGHPVAGDRVYGRGHLSPQGLGRQFLHAWRLAFSYPEGRRWQFESALPDDLGRVLKQLRRLRKVKSGATIR